MEDDRVSYSITDNILMSHCPGLAERSRRHLQERHMRAQTMP